MPSAIPLVLIAYAILAIGAEFTGVFTNAMMPSLVPPERIGRLSGTGWAVGYVGGLVSLVIVLGFLAANPQTGKTLLGLTPLFGFDPALREGDRAVGPLSAIWFVIFVLPLFLFTPDQPRARPLRDAVGRGLRHGRRHAAPPARSPQRRDVSSGQHDLCGRPGGDVRVRRHLRGRHIRLGYDPDRHVRHSAHHHGRARRLARRQARRPARPEAGDPRQPRDADPRGDRDPVDRARRMSCSCLRSRRRFRAKSIRRTAEKFFIFIGLFIGLVAGPLQAASRTLLMRLSPPGQITEFFGLFALSGKVTSFMAPFLVGVVTAATASQRAGMAVLVVFFGVGALALSRVRA